VVLKPFGIPALLGLSLAITRPALPAAPDTVLYNGKIFTSVESRPFVRAVAIQGDRITAVGSDDEIEALADTRTRKINLRGHAVIPGINDAHNHLGIVPRNSVRLNFPRADPSWPEAYPVLAAAERDAAPHAVMLGTIGPLIFKDVAVTRAALDRLAPGHPVVLTTFTGHACILNSAALARFGIGEDQPDFPGARFERASDGKLTGVLREYARMIVRRRLAEQTSDADGVKELRADLTDALKFGITSIQDMANAIPPERALRLLEATRMPLRVRVMRMPLPNAGGRDLNEGRAVQGQGAISVSGTKWMLDGTPLEGTYAPRDAHLSPVDLIEQLGLTFPDVQVKQMLVESIQTNDQALFHVSGYPAAKVLLRAMSDTGGPAVWAARRVRVEHGDGLLSDLFPEVKALGIVVVQNPQHLAALPAPLAARMQERKLQPLKSLLEAGIPLAFGSDDDVNPYLDISLAASHPDRPSEAITREQAVIAYSLASAFAEFAEKDLGSLEPGKFADLAVLSQDIFTVSATGLPATRSVLTLIGGKIAYDAHILH
jgi:predicted amidohydrolase YtcJ